MPRLHKRRKTTIEEKPLLLLEVWQQIRPRVIGSLAHDVLFVFRLISLFGIGWIITILFHGPKMHALLGIDFLFFLLSLRSIAKHT